MRRLAVFATFVLVSACSSDPGGGTDNNGSAWDLDAGGGDAAETNGSANGDPNGDPNGSTNGDPNGSTNGAPNGSTNGAPNGSTNGSNPDMGNGSGNGNEGEPCDLNSQCSGGLTCCAGFDGMGNCEADCFTGGLCGGDDGECPADTECCDLSGIGGPDTCLMRCGGGNGGGGMACDTNADCTGNDEVCCPGLDGMGECTTDCFTGGLCENDMECQGSQMCCDFDVSKVCLDQCSF